MRAQVRFRWGRRRASASAVGRVAGRSRTCWRARGAGAPGRYAPLTGACTPRGACPSRRALPTGRSSRYPWHTPGPSYTPSSPVTGLVLFLQQGLVVNWGGVLDWHPGSPYWYPPFLYKLKRQQCFHMRCPSLQKYRKKNARQKHSPLVDISQHKIKICVSWEYKTRDIYQCEGCQ